jgi:hypothetical protein
MTITRPPRGGDVHQSALERLGAARDVETRLRDAADAACGTAAEDIARDDLYEAEERVAAREAWLIWLERGF